METIRFIVHPTDFSEANTQAFLPAPRVALAAKATFSVLHVAAAPDADDRAVFPHVREILARWGLMQGDALPSEIARKVRIMVIKEELKSQSMLPAITQFLAHHPADLIMLASESRQAASRRLHGSLAEDRARLVKAPSLSAPRGRAVSSSPNAANCGCIMCSSRSSITSSQPKPSAPPLGFACLLAGTEAERRLLHVGKTPRQIERRAEAQRPLPVAQRRGDVMEAIIEEAND